MKFQGITRRDFVSGMSMGAAALAAGLSPLERLYSTQVRLDAEGVPIMRVGLMRFFARQDAPDFRATFQLDCVHHLLKRRQQKRRLVRPSRITCH